MIRLQASDGEVRIQRREIDRNPFVSWTPNPESLGSHWAFYISWDDVAKIRKSKRLMELEIDA